MISLLITIVSWIYLSTFTWWLGPAVALVTYTANVILTCVQVYEKRQAVGACLVLCAFGISWLIGVLVGIWYFAGWIPLAVYILCCMIAHLTLKKK